MRCAQFSKKVKREAPMAVRRSQRETVCKNQSTAPQPNPPTASSSTHNHTPSSSTATNGRLVHVHPATTAAVTKATTRSKTQQQLTTTLTSIGPKPSQSENKSSGRHPYPPTGNNAKLKHKCPFDGCPWRFATPYKLRRHIKSHTKETPYLCKECGRGFSVRYNLLMHIQTIHSQPSRYKCPMRGCKEAFHSQPRLNGHLRRIHKKDWKTIHTASGAGVKSERPEVKSCNSRGSSTSSIDSGDSTPSSPPPVPPSPSPKNGDPSPSEPTKPTPPKAAAATAAKPQLGKAARAQSKFSCGECQKDFSTQSKLTAHMRTHTGEKPFKCTLQGCDKCFVTKERLTRHAETHKNSNQFCCPHKNCRRIFLRQTHLKNHLKIHTQDHQFVCPVLDCSEKFSSEAEYNVHLNSHINYGYRCPHAECELSFPTRTRLAFHCRAVHKSPPTTETGTCLMDGIQPHLGMPSAQPQTTSTTSSSCYPPRRHSSSIASGNTTGNSSSSVLQRHLSTPSGATSSAAAAASASSSSSSSSANLGGRAGSHNFDKEIIKDVDLPGLSVDDIENVLSENADWSGEQIDQFLRSAVDLSEIESKLFTSGGYESDSGYSTYDVSPITSTAPMQLNYQNSLPTSIVSLQPCHALSPILTPVEQTPGPIFGCTLSPSNSNTFAAPISPAGSTHSRPETSCSSASGEMSFFPAVSSFSPVSSSAAITSQESFYSQQSCPIFTPYSQAQDYSTSSNLFGMSPQCFSEEPPSIVPPPIPSFSSQIPDIILPPSAPQYSTTSISGHFDSSSSPLLHSGFAALRRCSEAGSIQNGSFPVKPCISNEFSVTAECLVAAEPVPQIDHQSTAVAAQPVIPKMEHQQKNDCILGNSSNNNNALPMEGSPISEPDNTCLSQFLEGPTSMSVSPIPSESNDGQKSTSASPPPENTSPNDPQLETPVPNSQLQSLVSLCSQIPSFNKLVASSSNPTVFLVAVSTALSTLNMNGSMSEKQPQQQQQQQNTGEGEGELLTSDSEKLRSIDMTQLSSLVAKIKDNQRILEPTDVAVAAALNHEDKSTTTSPLESMIPTTESQGASPTAVSSPNVPGCEKLTVFAQVVPPQQNTSNNSKSAPSKELISAEPPTQASRPKQVNSKLVAAHEQTKSASTNSGTTNSAPAEKKGSKTRGCKSAGSSMKGSQRKKGQWPKSMNKANLLAFRQHILNQLRKGNECQEASFVTPVKDGEKTAGKIENEVQAPMRCEVVSPPNTAQELDVTYERNHSISYERNHNIQRCRSEPIDRLSPLNESTLHECQSVENINFFSTDGDELKMLLNSTDCSDILCGMQFNPDAFLSSSVLAGDGDVLEGFDGMTELDLKADDEITHLLSEGSPCDGPTDVDMECINEFFKETAPDSSGASISSPQIQLDCNLVLGSPHDLRSPSQSLSRSYSITSTASVQCLPENPSPISFSGELMQQSSVGVPSYTFPELNSLHGSVSDLSRGSVSNENSMKLHLQQLEMHNDPLLAGNACASGQFDM